MPAGDSGALRHHSRARRHQARSGDDGQDVDGATSLTPWSVPLRLFYLRTGVYLKTAHEAQRAIVREQSRRRAGRRASNACGQADVSDGA